MSKSPSARLIKARREIAYSAKEIAQLRLGENWTNSRNEALRALKLAEFVCDNALKKIKEIKC